MIPKFKIRCSAISKIMGGALGKPTEIQMRDLAALQAKEKRTEKQDETLRALIAKRDAPPSLQEGAKTYCKRWLKEQMEVYGRTASFSNKYTERGILCEPASITLISERMNYGMIAKNEQHFENEWMTGTPDLLLANIVEDAKTSWSWETFPLFETKMPDDAYEWQIDGYMDLTGRKQGAINYCLIDTPEEFIDKEARSQAWEAGMSEVEMELYDEVAAKMTYAGIPIHLRHKRWAFEYDPNRIQAIRTQVELCRTYIETELWPMIQDYSILIASQAEGVTMINKG